MSSNAAADQQEFSGAAYAIAGWHSVRLGQDELASLRKSPAPLPAAVQAPSLKHSDDQTVAALAALCRAMLGCELADIDYDTWGIVASSRFIGRGAVVSTIEKYANEGPWGVSMQVTPHQTVHAISSTLSLALRCHGPCIGAGGGPHDESSAVLAAISLLQRPSVRGVWLLFTGWEPEMTIDRAGRPTAAPECVAAALAMLPAPPAKHHSALRILGQTGSHWRPHPPAVEPVRLTTLFSAAASNPASAVSLRVDLGGGLRMELELQPAVPATKHPIQTAAKLPAPHFPVGSVGRETAPDDAPRHNPLATSSTMSQRDPIWITGIGALTPVGASFREASEQLIAGRTGIRAVAGFDVAEHPCRVAGQVLDIPCPADISPQEFAECLPLDQCALWCCRQALDDADLWSQRHDLRVGVVLGLGGRMDAHLGS